MQQPSIGRIVIYQSAQSELDSPRECPAIIVQAGADESCDLCVFALHGPQMRCGIVHCESPCQHRSWHWPPRI